MGPKNAVNFSIKRDNKNGKRSGLCNIQCLNAIIYKTFVQITTKYVEFISHRRNIDGANAPNAVELTRLGFSNMNIALANII